MKSLLLAGMLLSAPFMSRCATLNVAADSYISFLDISLPNLNRGGQYLLPGFNTVVAYGLDDLVTYGPRVPINVLADGGGTFNFEAWTGIASSTRSGDCGHWASNSVNDQGVLGGAGQTGLPGLGRFQQHCSVTNHLYCLQQ